MIGDYDLSKYSNEDSFTYIDISNDDGFWEIPCDEVILGDKTYSTSITAIIDSSTSYIYRPSSDVDENFIFNRKI